MITELLLAALFAQALAQLPTTGPACNKDVDCTPFATCIFYDFREYPAMWPPCPHVGYCVCQSGYVYATNGSCVPFVNLNLYDKCSNQVWERYNTPQQRCDGSKVICNTPTYVDRTGYCEPAPVPTFAPIPVVIVPVPTVTCQTVGFLAQCDSKTLCCSFGLTCENRGPNVTYYQCTCPTKTDIYDQGLGRCRPRVYGDVCLISTDCASGLISNQGYECRLGRCRCQSGYEPVDNQYWNETSRSTYTRRICIISTAVSWVPTGQQCTMDPQLFASLPTTRVCHPRAFCHLCYKDRAGYTVNQAVAKIGVCREMTCSGNGDCGNNGRCNNWGVQVDPPCERGMCDCNWDQGYYKDLFSRCAVYEKLRLGHRCIQPDSTTQLHPWYLNNEEWDDDKACVSDNRTTQIGYAGYNWGVLKCDLPLIEDADGNCVRNDDNRYQWNQFLGYNDYCEDSYDNRIPVRRCDASKGLTCVNFRCQCAASTTCAAGYGGCNAVGTSSLTLWDGAKCRSRGLADACNTSADCCGGTCNNGYCGCAAGLTMLQFSVTPKINNGLDSTRTAFTTQNYCFKNVTVVGKGQQCHLDPVTWNCGTYIYGYTRTTVWPLVCSSGLVCMRCPTDLNPNDEAYGVCRSVTAIPRAHPPPTRPCPTVTGPGGDVQPTGQWINGRWVGRWSSWNAANTISQSFVITFLALCAAFVNF